MTAVTPQSVATDALRQWQDLPGPLPTHRCVTRWITLGVITPAQPSKGPGSFVRYSDDDVKALRAIARMQEQWSEVFPPHLLPTEVVGAVWRAIQHGAEEYVIIGRPGIYFEIKLKELT